MDPSQLSTCVPILLKHCTRPNMHVLLKPLWGCPLGVVPKGIFPSLFSEVQLFLPDWVYQLPLVLDTLYASLGAQTEKAMATHSSTLACKIPWAEEPGRLQSMGSRRVGHDWATSLSLFTFLHWRRKWQPTPVFLPGEPQGWGRLVGSNRVGHDLAAAAAGAQKFQSIDN